MNKTKRKTFITILLTAALMFTAAFAVKVSAHAETQTTSDYFTITDSLGAASSSTVLDGHALILDLASGASAKNKSDMLLSDLEVKFNVDTAFSGTKVYFVLSYSSKLKNGNPTEEEKIGGSETVYKTDITNKIEVATGDNTVKVAIAENKYDVTVNGTTTSYKDKIDLAPEVFGGNVIGRIGFAIEEAAAEETASVSGQIKVDYINQRASETSDEWKQTFVFVDAEGQENENGSVKQAKPVVLFAGNFYNGSGETIEKRYCEEMTLSFTICSIKSSSLRSSDFKAEAYVSAEGAAEKEDFTKDVRVSADGKKLTLLTLDKEVKINIYTGADDDKEVYSTVKMKGVKDEEKKAPEYGKFTDENLNEQALAAFNKALNEATFENYEGKNGETVRASIRLGASNYLEIPTMQDLVKDNLTNYADMTYTVWYRNNNLNWTSTTSFRIPVATEGKYQFYVLFTDKDRNAMESTLFRNKDGELDGDLVDKYVFEFEVKNDAPISVTAASQERAYKNIVFTASSFTILAKDYEVEYKLEYSADGETKWEEIIPLADLKADTSEYKKYNEFAYDGSLTFTPAQIGYYRLTATVYETGGLRSAEDSATIQASAAPVRVVPDEENWLLNNVWSVVFLSIGTLSLIGIIVILCIKPKEERV